MKKIFIIILFLFYEIIQVFNLVFSYKLNFNRKNKYLFSNIKSFKMNDNKIKHLVLSGGGQAGFTIYGTLIELMEKKWFDINDIESIYSTSAGSFVSVMISLPISNNMLIDYFMKRPWESVFPINPSMIFNVYSKKGLYDGNFINEIFKPIFGACDISTDITLAEFYELTKIEHHFFTVDINTFEIVNISYKNYPHLKLLKVINMTCAIPYLFQPVFFENKCLVDGGVINNFPLSNCLRETKCLDSEVLGIKTVNKNEENPNINENSTLLDYTSCLLYHIRKNIQEDNKQNNVKVIVLPFEGIRLSSLREVIYSEEKRKELFEKGINIAKNHIKDLKL